MVKSKCLNNYDSIDKFQLMPTASSLIRFERASTIEFQRRES